MAPLGTGGTGTTSNRRIPHHGQQSRRPGQDRATRSQGLPYGFVSGDPVVLVRFARQNLPVHNRTFTQPPNGAAHATLHGDERDVVEGSDQRALDDLFRAASRRSFLRRGALVEPKNSSKEPHVDLDYLMILNDGYHGYTINGKGFPATEHAESAPGTFCMVTVLVVEPSVRA